MYIIVVINDNNYFAPSVFRSLCEFVGDCFGDRYFPALRKIPPSKTITSDFTQLMTSKKMVLS